jgi:hypothetical protein
MNLTWHIVKKDLRALRWPILLWVLVIVTKLGIGVAMLTADGTEGPEWFRRLDMFSKVMAGIEGVCFVFMAALIHEDLLVGTTAFWMTRPISGGRLLRAKLLGIGLVFWVMPVLVSLPWWQGCGYGLREIAWAAAETVAIQAIFVLVGLLWAVVTDGYARFLMWTLVMLIAIPSVSGVVGLHLAKWQSTVPFGVMYSRVWVVVALAVAGIIAVVIHQFLTRRFWRSVALIGTTVGLILMVALWWPWDLKITDRWYAYQESQVEANWPAATTPAGLTLALGGAELAKAPGARADRPVQLRMNYRVEGLSGSQALQPYVANFSLRWPDGTGEEGWSWIRPEQSISRLVTYRVLNQTPAEKWERDDSLAFQTIPAAIAARLQTSPAAYSLKVRYGVVEVASATSVPLQPGARTLNGFLGERLAHVEKFGDQLEVTFVRHSPALFFDMLVGGQNYVLGVGQAMARQFSQYLLVNHAHDFSDRGTTIWGNSTRIGTVEIAWQTLAYRAAKTPPGGRPTLDGINALNDAELIRVTLREQMRFAHEFKTDALSAQFDKP